MMHIHVAVQRLVNLYTFDISTVKRCQVMYNQSVDLVMTLTLTFDMCQYVVGFCPAASVTLDTDLSVLGFLDF